MHRGYGFSVDDVFIGAGWSLYGSSVCAYSLLLWLGTPEKRRIKEAEKREKYRIAAEGHLWTVEQKTVLYNNYVKNDEAEDRYELHFNDETYVEVNEFVYEHVNREDKIYIVKMTDRELPGLFFLNGAVSPNEYLEFPVKFNRCYASSEIEKDDSKSSLTIATLDEATIRECLEKRAADNIKNARIASWIFTGIFLFVLVVFAIAPTFATGILTILMVVALIYMVTDYFKAKKEYSDYKNKGDYHMEDAKCTNLRVENGKFKIRLQGASMDTEKETTKEVYLSSKVGQAACIIAYGDSSRSRIAYLIDDNGQYIELM